MTVLFLLIEVLPFTCSRIARCPRDLYFESIDLNYIAFYIAGCLCVLAYVPLSFEHLEVGTEFALLLGLAQAHHPLRLRHGVHDF